MKFLPCMKSFPSLSKTTSRCLAGEDDSKLLNKCRVETPTNELDSSETRLQRNSTKIHFLIIHPHPTLPSNLIDYTSKAHAQTPDVTDLHPFCYTM